jgi:hypothetical protein
MVGIKVGAAVGVEDWKNAFTLTGNPLQLVSIEIISSIIAANDSMLRSVAVKVLMIRINLTPTRF